MTEPSPTVLYIVFVFLIFAKIHKNIFPTVLHIGFVFLETWQISGEAWHLCKSVRDLAKQQSAAIPRAAVTPTRNQKTPITAAARWISDCGSATTGQRRSWTTCRSLGELALLADLPATDRGLADLLGAATEPLDEATGGGPPQREWRRTS